MPSQRFTFEQTNKPLLSKTDFLKRQLRFFLYATCLLTFSLGIGIVGYHQLAGLQWIDAFYNAAMILTGMGPVNEMPTNGAKVFGGFYALFSGVVFLSTVAVMFAPVIHRFFHLMHLDDILDN